ncbi:response regulator [Hymenobacter monticola]|uniref:Response regulator n=1 Tax=Hymenobacter monticola TaxID=1705399 RepID=A0ABY4B3Z3_9BACT|nr:response regulator [Hymenobacter monticola]UOE32756.1 response regulator [Hymenobacter monticola]
MKTLLIDDDPTVVFFIELLFQRAGLADALTVLQSPAQAVAYLQQQVQAGTPPEVVLLDLNMPLMSGWDVLDAIKPLEASLLGRCVVYVCTSSLAPYDAARAQQYPLVERLLQKPLNQAGLQAIQERAAQHAQKRAASAG